MTKDFLPFPNAGLVGPLLDLDRLTLTLCISFLTGHKNLGYHRSLREPGADSQCRFSGLAPKTAAHLYSGCPHLSGLRFDFTGYFVLPNLPDSWSVDRLVSFLRNLYFISFGLWHSVGVRL